MLKRSLVLFLGVVLFSCGDDDALDSSRNVNLDQSTMLSLVNSHRAEGANCSGDERASVSGLIWDDQLALAALGHSNDMQQNNFFRHEGQDGSSFSERVARTEFEGAPVGENIATGYASEQAVIRAWMDSQGHCQNIMNASATHVGVARSTQGALWTMVLGRK